MWVSAVGSKTIIEEPGVDKKSSPSWPPHVVDHPSPFFEYRQLFSRGTSSQCRPSYTSVDYSSAPDETPVFAHDFSSERVADSIDGTRDRTLQGLTAVLSWSPLRVIPLNDKRGRKRFCTSTDHFRPRFWWVSMVDSGVLFELEAFEWENMVSTSQGLFAA